LLANPEDVATMKANYEKGGYGYGHAKQALFELILDSFAKPRDTYNYYINNTAAIDAVLKTGAEKAGVVANEVLGRVRDVLGY
jgi:tryptophanyl-tRNA synthetase